jgi:hypothetical protein
MQKIAFLKMKRKLENPFDDRCDMADDVFLLSCEVPCDNTSKQIAIGFRHAIANVGKVSPLVIYPNDSFKTDLSELPFWSSLDAVDFLCALSESLGTEFTEAEGVQIPDPDWMPDSYSVKDMISKAVQLTSLRERIQRL